MKSGYSSVVLVSMLFLGLGMVLSRGWLNDFQGFVKDKVGGSGSSDAHKTAPASSSGFNGGSSGAPQAGTQGGGGSW